MAVLFDLTIQPFFLHSLPDFKKNLIFAAQVEYHIFMNKKFILIAAVLFSLAAVSCRKPFGSKDNPENNKEIIDSNPGEGQDQDGDHTEIGIDEPIDEGGQDMS